MRWKVVDNEKGEEIKKSQKAESSPSPKKGDLGIAKNNRIITLTSIAAEVYNTLQINQSK